MQTTNPFIKKDIPNFTIFIAKINEYNKAKAYYDHYVHLNNCSLMVIKFNHAHWEFDIVQLEKE